MNDIKSEVRMQKPCSPKKQRSKPDRVRAPFSMIALLALGCTSEHAAATVCTYSDQTLDASSTFGSGDKKLTSVSSIDHSTHCLSVFGSSGSARCLPIVATPSAVETDVASAVGFWNSSGAKKSGTLPVHGSFDLTQAFTAGKVTAFSGISASDVCSNANFNGSPGTASCVDFPVVTASSDLAWGSTATASTKYLTFTATGSSLGVAKLVFSGDTSSFRVVDIGGHTITATPSSDLSVPVVSGAAASTRRIGLIPLFAGQVAKSLNITATDAKGDSIGSYTASATLTAMDLTSPSYVSTTNTLPQNGNNQFLGNPYLLPNGKIAFRFAQYLYTYDVSAGTFSSSGSSALMSAGDHNLGWATLSDGKVIYYGGTATGNVYTPVGPIQAIDPSTLALTNYSAGTAYWAGPWGQNHGYQDSSNSLLYIGTIWGSNSPSKLLRLVYDPNNTTFSLSDTAVATSALSSGAAAQQIVAPATSGGTAYLLYCGANGMVLRAINSDGTLVAESGQAVTSAGDSKYDEVGSIMLDDGRIWVVGGRASGATNSSTSMFYTPSSNTWSAGPNLLRGRRSPVLVKTSSGKIVIFGGREVIDGAATPQSNLGVVEMMNPSTDTISSIATLNIPSDSPYLEFVHGTKAADGTLVILQHRVNTVSRRTSVYHIPDF